MHGGAWNLHEGAWMVWKEWVEGCISLEQPLPLRAPKALWGVVEEVDDCKQDL